MVVGLSSASSGINFGQPLRGDADCADDARKHLKRLVCKTLSVTHACTSSQPKCPRRLKFVAARAYGTEKHALMDMGAVPKLMPWDFCERLALSPTATDRQVTIDDGTVAQVIGCKQKVPVFYRTLVVNFGFHSGTKRIV